VFVIDNVTVFAVHTAIHNLCLQASAPPMHLLAWILAVPSWQLQATCLHSQNLHLARCMTATVKQHLPGAERCPSGICQGLLYPPDLGLNQLNQGGGVIIKSQL
jgi:hypothetical protein